MWRAQGLVGRVLHRYHANGPLRLPQNHHYVEDEVKNTSSLLSNSKHSTDSSSQREDDGERRRKQRTSHFTFTDLPRYTALDAVGWGAAAILFVQVCRRIHSQFSSGPEHRPTSGSLTEPSRLRKCSYRILLEILSRRDVLPRGSSVLCLQGVSEKQTQNITLNQNSSSSEASQSSEEDQRTTESPAHDHQRAVLDYDSSSFEDSLLSSSSLEDITKPHKTDTATINEHVSEEENLEEAAQNLRDVGDTSVPVILNIIGLQNANNDNYEEAFTCFLAAAELGYTKAQFNTGVCYEKGRGVGRDVEKAMHFYGQAAAKGHTQAQYRFAKLLLARRRQLSEDGLKTATNLLEEASAAGFTKAQVCLASVYSRKPEEHGNKSVRYLKMAAESGDNTALLYLGQCYETGLGVPPNLCKAMEYYRRAAKAGNKQAQRFLESPCNKGINTQNVLLRSIRSAPCFQRPLTSLGFSSTLSSSAPSVPPALIPHSWSTGSLSSPSALPSLSLHLHPESHNGDTCKWTLG